MLAPAEAPVMRVRGLLLFLCYIMVSARRFATHRVVTPCHAVQRKAELRDAMPSFGGSRLKPSPLFVLQYGFVAPPRPAVPSAATLRNAPPRNAMPSLWVYDQNPHKT